MTTNKDKVESLFECDYEYWSKKPGATFPSKCTLCGEIIMESWAKSGGDLEKGKAKKLRKYSRRLTHLGHKHPEKLKEISATFRHRRPYQNNSVPTNSTAAEVDENEVNRRVGPCFHCGARYCFRVLVSHRICNSADTQSGCPQFGCHYDNSINRQCPELVVANKRQKATATQQTAHRRQFIDFVAHGIDTIPLTVEEIYRPDRLFGVYVQLSPNDEPLYFGRTERLLKRTTQHEAHRVRYCTRGVIIPQRTTLHLLSELTFAESRVGEYYAIQLIDILTEHQHRPDNSRLPYPWTPQSKLTDGTKLREQNLVIHSEGRRLVSELLRDVILLHRQGQRLDVIELEKDPDAAVAEEVAESEAPAKTTRRFCPRRKRPSAPDNLQLATCSSASSSTAPTTPATPTTFTPTLAPELSELKRKLEESEQRNKELAEDNKNKEEQRKRYKRKTHEFSAKVNKLAERFNASVSPMTSPGSLPSQPPSQPAPLSPPCFDPPI